MGESNGSGALPRSYSQWIKDRDDEEKVGSEGGESKCVVALCPCLVCCILLLIVFSVILIVKFHFFCHTPLHSLVFKKNCH
ncbi:hypothetical protein OIU79_019736 [Salix purpurea]|uniref:Uncharacterized protein n=1 Tax=Salix purpurea TaxID=77065 RepID=A0A9Q0P1W7_SALPP|nr:hypothetical protein OIU79_019736 [Salix purpurea]